MSTPTGEAILSADYEAFDREASDTHLVATVASDTALMKSALMEFCARLIVEKGPDWEQTFYITIADARREAFNLLTRKLQK